MCGLGGYAGITSERFVRALGAALDDRGGHAAGWVTNGPAGVKWATRVGEWCTARRKFQRRASEGTVGIVHTRFATCGRGGQGEAHPFEIRRKGTVALYGAHNGMIDDAAASAALNDRPYTVDSRELFELIADSAWSEVQAMSGYGVVCWIEPADTAVYLARLTESGEVCVVSIAGGGFAWASTWAILAVALHAAGLTAVHSYPLDVGVVYRVTAEGIYKTTETRCKLAERRRWASTWASYDWPTDDELDVIVDAQADDLLADVEAKDIWDEESDGDEEYERVFGKWYDRRCGS